MNGYILKSMERVDFQLSPQVSMLDEANEADIVLAKVAESKPEIQWKIVSYGKSVIYWQKIRKMLLFFSRAILYPIKIS